MLHEVEGSMDSQIVWEPERCRGGNGLRMGQKKEGSLSTLLPFNRDIPVCYPSMFPELTPCSAWPRGSHSSALRMYSSQKYQSCTPGPSS